MMIATILNAAERQGVELQQSTLDTAFNQVVGKSGDAMLAKRLIAMGANPLNWQVDMGHNFMPFHTVLLLAAERGCVDMVALLLDAGADIERRLPLGAKRDRPTPLGLAARWSHDGVVPLLVRRGAEPSALLASELQCVCRALAVNVSGSKSTLIARIRAWAQREQP
eukprot:TRINITY_DN60898_c0_g1_i1.p1 TRINITY_DN60898_c0_g1~~TRINITY_DN60898_c0_g1_i1.p1  ORF type:complete len:167 (-),score=16.60 TRINITY_DN60898_c0_g1_i1:40-540(-)